MSDKPCSRENGFRVDCIKHYADVEAENARLKAEVERFKFTLEEERQITRQDWAGLRCEHDRVKRALEQAEAEVERLTKLCQATSPDGFVHVRDIKHHPIMGPAWEKRQNAAKEGKQS